MAAVSHKTSMTQTPTTSCPLKNHECMTPLDVNLLKWNEHANAKRFHLSSNIYDVEEAKCYCTPYLTSPKSAGGWVGAVLVCEKLYLFYIYIYI